MSFINVYTNRASLIAALNIVTPSPLTLIAQNTLVRLRLHHSAHSTLRHDTMRIALLLVCLLSLTSANPEALQKFVEGNRWFSGAVYKEVLAKNDGNFLVCPFSAEVILALAQCGAKDETGEEIRTALRLPNSQETGEVFKALLPKLKGNDLYKFNAANKIYVKDNFPVTAAFNTTAIETFQASSQNLDFTQPDAARIINDWVSEKTEGKIRDLIDSEALTDDTVMVLVNALYFSGSWKKHFKARSTQKRKFYKTNEDVVEVDTMKKSDYYGYYESEELGAKFLEMPFKGAREVKMVIVLPNDKEGLKELEGRVEEVYSGAQFQWETVEVELPKFKIETSIDFKRILKNLGVQKAFSRADFSGLAGEKGEIHISNVVQKAFISVNENGVEAAAATAVLFHPKSLMDFYGSKTFVVDHPFMFYIKVSDIVIFTGRVVSP
jgi:serpin B